MFNMIQYIRDRWSQVSPATGQRGTFVDELATKPTGIIISDFYNALNDARMTNNINNWQNMTEEQLGDFAARFFIKRAEGNRAVGTITLYFDTTTSFDVNSDVIFAADDGTTYNIAQPITVTKGFLKASDNPYALYEVTLPIVATLPGTSGNKQPGTITEVRGLSVGYKFASNKNIVSGGVYREDNERLYNRMRRAINDRSLSNERSIISMLPEFFPIVRNVYVAGAGDQYMQRDLIYGVTRGNSEANYLGKTPGNNIVPHIGYVDFFPPRIGSLSYVNYKPFTLSSAYEFPVTISPVDSESDTIEDPGLDGVALESEMSIEQYTGLYFDDITNNMNQQTEPILDTFLDGLDSFVVGNHYRPAGVFEELGSDSDLSVTPSPVSLENGEIILSAITKTASTIMAMANISKRGGVKLTGKISFPDPDDDEAYYNSTLQIGVAGDNSRNPMKAFTGIGFGIHSYKPYDNSTNNAAIFIYVGTSYDQDQVYAAPDWYGGTAADGNAIIEIPATLDYAKQYEFELFLNDRSSNGDNRDSKRNVSATLVLSAVGEVTTPIKLSAPTSSFQPILNEFVDNSNYMFGESVKISLTPRNANNKGQWIVSDLVAVDIAESHAQAYFAIDVEKLTGNVELKLSAYGSGYRGATSVEGVNVYIWNPNGDPIFNPSSSLNSGNWQLIPELSGTASNINKPAYYEIGNISNYILGGAFSGRVMIMVQSIGASKAFSRYAGGNLADVEAVLNVGYISMSDKSTKYYHSNTECDVYATTYYNIEQVPASTIELTKLSTESYFTLSKTAGADMPVANILGITVISPIQGAIRISGSEYTTQYESDDYRNSVQEVIRITLEDQGVNTIQVEYATYPRISNIQDFFSSSIYKQNFGSYLVKHAFPVRISIAFAYSGNSEPEDVRSAVALFMDEMVTTVFSMEKLIEYLRGEGYIISVNDSSVSIEYTKLNSRFEPENYKLDSSSGYTLVIKPIEFFYVDTITIEGA